MAAETDSETSFSSASTSSPAAAPAPEMTTPWRGFLRHWRQKSMRRLATFPPVGVVPKLPRWRSGKEVKDSSAAANTPADVDFCLFKPSWKSFSFSELQHATDNFNPGLILSHPIPSFPK